MVHIRREQALEAEEQIGSFDSRPADDWVSQAAEGVTPWSLPESYALAPAPKRKADMSGAVVGLALLSVACLGICASLYHLMGPRSTFAAPDE